MRAKAITGLTTAFVITAMLLATLATADENNKNFVISGASAVAEVATDLVASYEKSYTGVKGAVSISSSGQGLQDLLAGQADLAMVNREMTDKEKKQFADQGVSVVRMNLGYIALAVVTKAENPVENLSMAQLKAIFTGSVANWKEVSGPDTPIEVVTREAPKRGSAVLFQSLVLGGEPYAKQSRIAERWNTIVKQCAKEWAISYLPTTNEAVLNPQSFGLKILRVKFADDTPIGPRDQTYTIKMPFNLFWNAKAEKVHPKQFSEFAQTEVRLEKVPGIAFAGLKEDQPR